MDDPLLARANNTELIRDILAIMFHGDATRACLLLQTVEKPNFLPDFFRDRLPASDICLSMCIGRRMRRSPDKMQNSLVQISYRIVTANHEIKFDVETSCATSEPERVNGQKGIARRENAKYFANDANATVNAVRRKKINIVKRY